MIVISDTSPLNYLVLLGADHVLTKLFGQVIIPPSVLDELRSLNLRLAKGYSHCQRQLRHYEQRHFMHRTTVCRDAPKRCGPSVAAQIRTIKKGGGLRCRFERGAALHIFRTFPYGEELLCLDRIV